ncbi:hypothetical protein [Nonomuraea dietziae]|uniref:hypothetical protein n=1 Tax=Nonomuraea dietziae TaxID=65515 RepID=UPI003426B80B
MMSSEHLQQLREHAQAAHLLHDADELAAVVTELAAEVQAGRVREGLLRSDYGALLTAARASIAAEQCGEAAPLTFLRWELARHGQLPADHTSARRVLADASATLALVEQVAAAGSADGVQAVGA